MHAFRGTLKAQTFFHTTRSDLTPKCSIRAWCFSLKATWYVDLKLKSLGWFSFQTNLSREEASVQAVAGFPSCVLWVKRSNILSLSRCPVLGSIRSFTSRFGWSSLRKSGLWDNYLCFKTTIQLPSPTFHFKPSTIMSLAAKRLHYVGSQIT